MEIVQRVSVVGALTIVALTGCGRQDAPKRDSTAATGPASAVRQRTPLCARTGHWGECQLRIRLEQSGLAPTATTDKVGDVPDIASPSVSFQIGAAGMIAYFFADTLARHRAAAALDTARFIPPSQTVGVHAQATSIENDNLLAVLFSRNEHQRERVADAITAGPPQP